MKLFIENEGLKQAVFWICDAVSRRQGGRALLVGGCVRNMLLGIQSADFDLEVYGLSASQLRELLEERFRIDLVGEAFGVIKIRGYPIDVSLPRRESKTGSGHRGFEISSDPSLPYREACSRRDFTVNSMAFDPLRGELIDPFGGKADLERGVLRHTSGKFPEDPLRVLRGMQFLARFDFEPAPETVELCRRIPQEGLPRERIFEEWKKLILQGVRPSLGLSFLKESGWLKWYPELESLCRCPQDPHWHPEGDVWTHTLSCLDTFARARLGDSREDLIVGLAVLCHDLGKPAATKWEERRYRSKGHEKAGEAPTRSLLFRITNRQKLIEEVVGLVLHHMRPQMLYEGDAGDSAVRRLARNAGRIDRLVRVAEADYRGREGRSNAHFRAGRWLLKRAEQLAVQNAKPEPLVMGRHLIQLGLKPGPHFGEILSACYEAQLKGEFTTLNEGIRYARSIIESRSRN